MSMSSTSSSSADARAAALEAWRRVDGQRRQSVRVVPFEKAKPSNKTRLFRLEGALGSGSTVIAKCTTSATAELEWSVYREVLAAIGSPSPHALGMIPAEQPGWSWLFVEESEGEPFDEDNAAHRQLAGEWLATFHAATLDLPVARRLPEGEPARGSRYVRTTLRLAKSALDRGHLASSDQAVLRDLLGLLSRLDNVWPSVVTACATLPRAVLHGDFKGRNVRIVSNRGVAGVSVFDWEMAAWGVAVADLYTVDTAAWARTYAGLQRGVDLPSIDELATLATLFRMLAALAWASESLVYVGVERRMWNVRAFTEGLATTMRVLRCT